MIDAVLHNITSAPVRTGSLRSSLPRSLRLIGKGEGRPCSAIPNERYSVVSVPETYLVPGASERSRITIYPFPDRFRNELRNSLGPGDVFLDIPEAGQYYLSATQWFPAELAESLAISIRMPTDVELKALVGKGSAALTGEEIGVLFKTDPTALGLHLPALVESHWGDVYRLRQRNNNRSMVFGRVPPNDLGFAEGLLDSKRIAEWSPAASQNERVRRLLQEATEGWRSKRIYTYYAARSGRGSPYEKLAESVERFRKLEEDIRFGKSAPTDDRRGRP